jgi:hypothetical protein
LLHVQHNSSQAPKRSLYVTRRRAAMAFSSIIVLGLITAIASCSSGGSSNNLHFSFKDPSGEPIKAVVRTTVPLAYAASVAMSSVVTGSTPTNAAFIYNNCPTNPAGCTAVITITDDDSSVPLQLTSAGTGTITVYGYWSSATQAILTVAFSGDAGSSLFPVHNISLFPVSKNGSSLEIVYASIDINATVNTDPKTWTSVETTAPFEKLKLTASSEASANVNLDAWIIDVDDAGTPGDFSDDKYNISGGGEYIDASSGSGSVLQLGMADVVVGPGCALNPVAGLAVINEVEASSSNVVLATALITFHSACDGNAKVTLATGNYLLANGKSIPLNLDSP